MPEVLQGECGSQEHSKEQSQRDRQHHPEGRVRVFFFFFFFLLTTDSQTSPACKSLKTLEFESATVSINFYFIIMFFQNFTVCFFDFFTKMLCKLPVLGIESIMKRQIHCYIWYFRHVKVFITFESQLMSVVYPPF